MKSVFFISDRTAVTTEVMGNALLTQFDSINFHKEILPFIDSLPKVDKALAKINSRYIQDQAKVLVLTSIINPQIRNKFTVDYITHIDFFETLLPLLEKELKVKASGIEGKSHGISDENKYYKRIEAIDYAMSNDDGVHSQSFDQADVILVGISRVGKTPTCLYLAINYGIKAANYPLVESDLQSDKLPKPLVPYHNKLFALTIDTDRLHHIRSNRLPNSQYADIVTCNNETEAAQRIINRQGLPSLNTSKKSIEEIAASIMQRINLQRKF